MRINAITVDGYRRFKNQTINLENTSTVIAGANNSGKTSFIDLLRVILGGERSLSVDDLNASERVNWTKSLLTAAIEGEERYLALVSDENFASNSPSIEVRLEVAYDPAKDDIRQFADYLMDLDESKHAFYFLYKYAAKPDQLTKLHRELYPKIRDAIDKHGWSTSDGIEPRSSPSLKLHALTDAALDASFSSRIFFSDRLFGNIVEMASVKDFSKLFNFRSIKASRALDDTGDDHGGQLNQRLVAVAKEDEKWAKILAELPDMVVNAIDATDIRAITSENTLQSLNQVIRSVSLTNGTTQSDLFVDFQMSEEQAIQLISRSMQTRYLGQGVTLGEGSQGLGYSNLIYLHLEAESFIRAATAPENALLVNLLVIEEPESHMHPQMQNAFIKHLYKRVEEAGVMHALVTTHSNEIIRSSEVRQLRVLRIDAGQCAIIDLRKFHESEVAGRSTETQRLFSFLYAINFSDILFADKVIMYEGDTERMYIQAVIAERADLAGLRTQYISYVQVGGAYAHVYKPLIADTLKLKTVIVTDLDYEKESTSDSADLVRSLASTNGTLNHFFGTELGSGGRANPSVGDLHDLVASAEVVAEVGTDGLVGVAYQAARDGHARTFEEAILSRFLAVDVWHTQTAEQWNKYRSESKLKFSIPRKESSSIREIVTATGGNKTDFMYSLLVKKGFEDKVPAYILSALKWLNS